MNEFRVFCGVTTGTILAFTFPPLIGDKLYQNWPAFWAILVCSVVIGAAITWGFYMWPKEDKGMGF